MKGYFRPFIIIDGNESELEYIIEKGSVMEDKAIIDLYWKRSEHAISETSQKYGGYCFCIANNILSNKEDSEESVNDTWLAAWNTIPPKRPDILAVFLGKITRYISLDRWRKKTAAKRGGGEVPLVLDELEECVAGRETVELQYLNQELSEVLNYFLRELPEMERKIFMCRYWYMDSIADISIRFGFSESKVTSMLYRIRGKLKEALEKEGFA